MVKQIYLLIMLSIGSILGRSQTTAQTLPDFSPAEYYEHIRNVISIDDIGTTILQYDTLRMLALEEDDSTHIAYSHSCVGEIHFMYSNMEASKEAYLKSSKITKQFSDQSLYIKDCTRLLGAYRNIGVMDSALYYMHMADSLMQQQELSKLKKQLFYNEKAMFYETMGQSDSSVYYYIKAVDQVDTAQHRILLAFYSNIGGAFAARMNYAKALEYYDRILAMPDVADFPRGHTQTLIKKGQLLKQMGQLDAAETYILRAIDIEEQQIIKIYWGNAYAILADIYLKKGKFELAKATINTINNVENSVKERFLPTYYIPKTRITLYDGQYGAVPALLNKTKASILASTNNILDHIEYQDLKAQYFKATGQLDSANVALNEYIVLRDSFYNISQSNIVHDLETAYQTELKEQKINLLDTENKLSNAKLSSARRQMIGLAIGLLVLIGLLWRVFSLNNKLEIALTQKDFLIKEVHHRVKNNLQFISSLLNLQSEHVKDANAISALQEGQDRVQSMSLIHQKLYQKDNITSIDLQDYFENLIENLFDSYNINPDTIQLHMDVQQLALDVDTAIPLGLIVNELISNALKYAFPKGTNGVIRVVLKETKQKLSLSIQDNGIGMPNAIQNDLDSSFGYKLIRAFLIQLDATMEITSDNGTRVHIQMADYKKVT